VEDKNCAIYMSVNVKVSYVSTATYFNKNKQTKQNNQANIKQPNRKPKQIKQT
jgi:hypothetical protein